MRTLESDRQRDIAARMFLHLVTPSRTKIAQRTEDLVVFAAAPEVEVRSVLNALSDLDTVSNKEQTRILRRLSHPEQYEIFHDVLAEHVLGWRQQYDGQRDRERVRIESEQKAEAERKQLQLEQAQAIAKEQTLRADEQAAAAKRLRRGLIALVAVLIVALTTSVYAYYQRRLAQVHLLQAQAFAKAEQARAEQALNEKAAALAEKAGQARKAEQYREQADQNAKTAQTWTEYASQQGASAYSNPHCNCDSDLQMKDFTPTAGRNDKWLIAQFDICRTNAMDDPSTTTTVDWGDPPGSPQPAALGDWLHGSPDIYGTHLYSKPGTFMVTARMETTCHYRGAGQCDYHCVADGHVRVNVKQ
jgi:flagellar hook protein FlgE